jgi:dethiobiotin synthetase
MTKVFVTGTDTGVGKTIATCALIRALKIAKPSVARHLVTALKPVASDAVPTEFGLRNLDALLLQACQIGLVSNTDPQLPTLNYQQINPLCYQPAIAPHIAAMKIGEHLDIERVDAACQQAFEHYQLQQAVAQKGSDALQPIQLLEGAGGFLVPLNTEQSYADWVTKQRCSVLMVVQIKLGCINHSLLTYEAIKARNLHFAGWIANAVDTDRPAVYENIRTLANHLGEPLAQLPLMSEITELRYQLGSIETALEVVAKRPHEIAQLFDQMVHYFDQDLLKTLYNPS